MFRSERHCLEAYNKHGGKGHGTLEGNWFEEQQLREATGVGRFNQPQHLPKRHEELYRVDPQEIRKPTFEQMSTCQRLFGAQEVQVPQLTSLKSSCMF
jgi:hypothetical protein